MTGASVRPTLLCILDGFGLNPNPIGNAVALAKKPVLDSLMASSPNQTLTTFGERVGLPEGQMGNSEVGHLNIGAGRVIEQWLLRVGRALKGDFLNVSKEYQTFIEATKKSRTLHLMGLFSDGGVHSHSDHVVALIERVVKDFTGTIRLHIFTDGRDTSPQRSVIQLEKLEEHLRLFPKVSIATICGRFHAMDRDKRWERTKKAFDLIAKAEGEHVDSAINWVKQSYRSGITDEFIEPASINYQGVGTDDAVIFWNFREDRMRQIVAALATREFTGFEREAIPFQSENVLCFTDYDPRYHLPYLFHSLDVRNHLGEVIAANNLQQLRVAETEKYAHVTYFFNGGLEAVCPGEERVLIPSPREVKTYDQKPEMSASGVADAVIAGVQSGKYHFIVVNFANCDMVGHTGSLEAATVAVETVDECLGKIITALDAHNWQAVIIADHGNAEQMINYDDGTPHTAHTTYPVPIIIYGRGDIPVNGGGALSDVAPTILKLMELSQPAEMTGAPLI